jgi:protein-tyrosine phosphatase
MKILFVCTANICRSFMAERIFKKKLDENGRSDILVLSAALLDMKNAPADPNAVSILDENGFDGNGHNSKLLTEDMAVKADMILVMTLQHRKKIIENYPDAKDKTFLLKPFSITCFPQGYNDYDNIVDPYRLSDYQYRACFTEIYMAVEGLIKCI